jgi:hypothetical protein
MLKNFLKKNCFILFAIAFIFLFPELGIGNDLPDEEIDEFLEKESMDMRKSTFDNGRIMEEKISKILGI